MKVSVLNMAGSEVGEIDLPSAIFETKINRGLMHQALVRQLANARRGTHSAKTRAEIRRTTAKWYRQKGTGRARHGSRRAPIFVGGGVAHGPKPRSYRKDMPRKMRRAALRSALSAKASTGDIVVLDKLDVDQPKTKQMVSLLDVLTGQQNALILMSGQNRNVELSSRNLPTVKVLPATYLNIRDLLGYQKIVLPLPALEVIQAYLGDGDGVPEVVAVESVASSAEEEE
jgi:large subunit ribosomal protein L4